MALMRKGRNPGAKALDLTSSALIILGLLTAAINIFTKRPDADDFNFIRGGLVATSDLWRPFSLNNTGFDISSLPPLSPAHLMASYDNVAVLVAALLHIPPIVFVHYIAGSLLAFLVPIAFYVAIRSFEFKPAHAVVGAMAAIVFLMVSGDTHRDWGNFTLTRFWQGKCILVGLYIPLIWVFSLAWARSGETKDLRKLILIAVSGVGVSGSALFLIPWTVASASCGFLMARRFARPILRRVFIGVSLVLVISLVTVVIGMQLVAAPHETTVWEAGWPGTPLASLTLVMPRLQQFVTVLVLLSGVLLVLKTPLGPALAFGILGNLLLLFLPLTSQLLMAVVKPAAYWRFFYTIPVPLCFGLLMAGIANFRTSPISRYGEPLRIALLLVVVIPLISKHYAVNTAMVSLPISAKFDQHNLEGARRLSDLLPPRAIVLAPQDTVVVLGLLRPDIRFISTRPAETKHVFDNANLHSDGAMRVALQSAVESCSLPPQLNLSSVQLKADAVIVAARCRQASSDLLRALQNKFRGSAVFYDSGEKL